jgi:hypothetical protein
MVYLCVGVSRARGVLRRGRLLLGAFAMLLAGFVFLYFAGTIRSVLGTAEATVRGSCTTRARRFRGCPDWHRGDD